MADHSPAAPPVRAVPPVRTDETAIASTETAIASTETAIASTEAAIASTYRQGDVLIISAPHAPVDDAAAVPRIGGRVILAFGEATGHSHAIADRDAHLYRTDGTDQVLQIGASGATLAHEEHAAIHLVPGTYIVRRQREYVPGWAGSTHVSD